MELGQKSVVHFVSQFGATIAGFLATIFLARVLGADTSRSRSRSRHLGYLLSGDCCVDVGEDVLHDGNYQIGEQAYQRDRRTG